MQIKNIKSANILSANFSSENFVRNICPQKFCGQKFLCAKVPIFLLFLSDLFVVRNGAVLREVKWMSEENNGFYIQKKYCAELLHGFSLSFWLKLLNIVLINQFLPYRLKTKMNKNVLNLRRWESGSTPSPLYLMFLGRKISIKVVRTTSFCLFIRKYLRFD